MHRGSVVGTQIFEGAGPKRRQVLQLALELDLDQRLLISKHVFLMFF